MQEEKLLHKDDQSQHCSCFSFVYWYSPFREELVRTFIDPWEKKFDMDVAKEKEYEVALIEILLM